MYGDSIRTVKFYSAFCLLIAQDVFTAQCGSSPKEASRERMTGMYCSFIYVFGRVFISFNNPVDGFS